MIRRLRALVFGILIPHGYLPSGAPRPDTTQLATLGRKFRKCMRNMSQVDLMRADARTRSLSLRARHLHFERLRKWGVDVSFGCWAVAFFSAWPITALATDRVEVAVYTAVISVFVPGVMFGIAMIWRAIDQARELHALLYLWNWDGTPREWGA